MRDGVELSANIWRPNAEGKFPVIFQYTPYDNNASYIITHAKYFVPRGYVLAAIDVRGRYDSEGESYLYWDTRWREGKFDGQDVYDCQTWLAEQRWSSGKIGMTKESYRGFVQWMGATLGNPYLTTIIPYMTPDDHYDNVYPSGAFQLSNSLNLLRLLGNLANKNRGYAGDWQKLYRHLPLRTLDEAMFGRKDVLWQDLIDHPNNDEYWRFSVGDRPRAGEMGAGKYSKVTVPTLNITGWYDQVSQATINNYLGMVRYGPEGLRNRHHLIVGPWRHGTFAPRSPRSVGDLDFGQDSAVDFHPLELRWYDYWLKGIDNGMMDEPSVQIFVMGENRWRSEQQWPLSRARQTRYYFHSAGQANTRSGDGGLSTTPPGEEPTDSFIYDPERPVPTRGGNVSMRPSTSGPRDQRQIQTRDDVLVYTGEALAEDIEVTGRLLAKLYAASSATDTDFTAKLVDVHPNGYAQILAEGIIRARYRNSFKKQELLTPGQVYKYTIDLWSVSHVFKQGHKIQVEISSSNFPKYDRNPNTGHKFGEDDELQEATQTIYHNRRYPSHVVLPVLPFLGHSLHASPPAEEFLVIAYPGPPRDQANLERYREIADAGIDVIVPANGAWDSESNLKALDLAAEVGLRVIVTDLRILPWHEKDRVRIDQQRIDAVAADYRNHPALFGYVICDEPNARYFEESHIGEAVGPRVTGNHHALRCMARSSMRSSGPLRVAIFDAS